MAKRTIEEKQKRQRDKLMGTTSTAEGKEYTPAVDEKDKLIEKYRKRVIKPYWKTILLSFYVRIGKK